MAIRKIARMGNPVLYEVAQPVTDPTDPEVARLARDMQDTLTDLGASAMAAPQVFESTRIVVYGRQLVATRQGVPLPQEVGEDAWVVMVNPVLTPLTEESVLGWERCLSLPGLHGKVPRCPRIRCAFQMLDGAAVEHAAEGNFAVLLQHECDHLDGILYPMRMAEISKLEFDAEPGHLAKDIQAGADVWPPFRKLVDEWPGRERWLG